jgi:hypothetical protein
MRKCVSFFLVFVLILFIADLSYSQVTRTTKRKPLFVIEANGGYDLALLDLRGSSLAGVWSFNDYGQKSGFGGELKFKLSVMTRKRAQLRPYLSIAYMQFKNDDTKAYIPNKNIPPGWPGVGFSGSGTYTPRDTVGSSQFVMNFPSVALGLEYAVYTDSKSLSSFNFGLDFPITVLFGQHTETYASGQSINYDMQASTRVGIGLNTIYNYRVAPAFGFNVGMRFAIPNLLGKNSKQTEFNGEFYPLDAADASLTPLLSSSRTMASLRFMGGFTFYIGAR